MVIRLKQLMYIMKQKSNRFIRFYIPVVLLQLIFFCSSMTAQTIKKKSKSNTLSNINNKIIGNGNTIVNGDFVVKKRIIKNIVDSSKHYYNVKIYNPADTIADDLNNIGYEITNDRLMFYPKIGFWQSPYVQILSSEVLINSIDFGNTNSSTSIYSNSAEPLPTDTSKLVNFTKIELSGIKITKEQPAILFFKKFPSVLKLGDEKRNYFFKK